MYFYTCIYLICVFKYIFVPHQVYIYEDLTL